MGERTGSQSLDDVLRQMYDELYLKAPNASYYLKGRGYTEEDFVRVLVAGCRHAICRASMTATFVEWRLCRMTPRLPLSGLRLVKSTEETVSTGIVIERTGAGLRLAALADGSGLRRGPVLQQGDQLVSIGGSLVTRANWQAALDRVQARRSREGSGGAVWPER